MQVDYVVLAIPVFFVLIGIEALATRLQGRGSLSLEDAVSSLGCGILQQFSQVLLRTAFFAGYLWVYGHLRLLTLPSGPWVWVLCVLGVDCLAYWSHRLGHEVAVFWAVHEVHHQSEDLSLTVSLRVPALDYYSWAFDLPLALLGFPPGTYLAAASFVSIYGFSSHTRAIGRLGPLEWLFVTPSHHQLHHARNAEYLDRNYGHVFIVWDRLFGTFVEAGAEPVYGTTVPLRSANPVWANLRYWFELVAKVRRMPRLADRLRALVSPPGWMPAAAPSPTASAGPHPAVAVPAALRLYALAQFVPALLATTALLNAQSHLAGPTMALAAAFVGASVALCGGLLDGGAWARRIEPLRVPIAAVVGLWAMPTPAGAALAVTYAAVSWSWLSAGMPDANAATAFLRSEA